MNARSRTRSPAPPSAIPLHFTSPAVQRRCDACQDDDAKDRTSSAAATGALYSFGDVSLVPPASIAPRSGTWEVSQPHDAGEREADAVAEDVMRRLSSSATPPPDESPRGWSPGSGLRMQRQVDPASAPLPSHGSLLLDDDTTDLLPGQMRKSEFLAALRPAVCDVANRELAAVGRDAEGCPYLEQMFSYYASRQAQHVERAIRKYAPEASSAQVAADYIPLMTARIAEGVKRWVAKEEMPELPEGLTPAMLAGGGGVLGAIGGAFSSMLGAVGGAIESGLSAVGGVLFQAEAGAARGGVDARVVATRLGHGRALDGAARARMEGAFGHSFEHVRIHDDAGAAHLSRDLGARAFTVGAHVAFAAGQYRPGTAVGDALLAHELAHVIQQRGAVPARSQARVAGDDVERDADEAAIDAMGALYGERIGLDERPRNRSLSRAALGLARCGGEQQKLTPFEQYVVEGTRLLRSIRFGLPYNRDPSSGVCQPGAFDDKNWKLEAASPPVHCMLVNRTDPGTAIEELFAHPERWSIDCSIFSQLPTFYALVKTEGKTKFNARVNGRIELKQIASGGLKTKEYWAALGPDDRTMVEQKIAPSGFGPELTAQGDNFITKDLNANPRRLAPDELLKIAPIGSRVVFTHGLQAYLGEHRKGRPFHNENTTKVGEDRYAAHGLLVRRFPWTKTTNELSKDEVIEQLARTAGVRDDQGQIIPEHYDEAKPLIYISAVEIYDVPK